jgi:hypothetical protein
VEAADALVGVVAGDDEVGDLAVDLVVEAGEGRGREFCTTSVQTSGGAMPRFGAHRDALPRLPGGGCALPSAAPHRFWRVLALGTCMAPMRSSL